MSASLEFGKLLIIDSMEKGSRGINYFFSRPLKIQQNLFNTRH